MDKTLKSEETNKYHGKEMGAAEINMTKKADLSRFMESALIVTLLTAAVYFIGYGYYDSFFARLALPDRTLNLPIVIYLREAFWHCFFFSFIAMFSFLGANKKPDSFFTALRGNSIVLFFFLISIFYILRTSDSWHYWIFLIGSIPILISIIRYSKKNKSLAHYIYTGDWIKRFGFVGGAIFIVFYLASLMGDIHAKKLIQGELHKSLSVSFKMKNGKSFMPKKKLILIMNFNGKYYLTEKNDNPPLHSTVYIVPESEVALAEIKRIN